MVTTPTHGTGTFTCEQCRQEFSPGTGGICSGCGRLLCGVHLHGWLGQFIKPWLGREPVCVDCRRRRADSPRPGVGDARDEAR